MHAYLARTETFVQNQMSTLRRWRPVVVAHHLRPENHFRYDAGATAADLLPPRLARLDALAYRAARLTLPQTTRALAQYTNDERARLLHFHFLTDARFLLGVKRKAGLPAIVSCYGYDVSSFPRKWKGLAGRYLEPTFGEIDCFLAMSEDMRSDLMALGCPESRVRIHYYGSDTTRFRYPERRYDERNPVTVLACGRLEPRKAQNLVLQALRRLEEAGHDAFRVVFVGEGRMRGELERLVAEYGWEDRVTLTGHIPYTSERLEQHFREADVFALPSVTVGGLKEGIPGTIVEAMASGLPVVGSFHAGIPAVIENGRDGLLVPEDDVGALGDALEALLTDAALRERLGRSAAKRAERELDLTVRTRALEQIYDEVAG